METSIYTLHTYRRLSAGEKDLFSTRALSLKMSVCCDLQNRILALHCKKLNHSQLVGINNWSDGFDSLFLCLCISLSSTFPPSLLLLASLSFPYSASPRAKSWALAASVLLSSSLHPTPAATLLNLCQESLCSELQEGREGGTWKKKKRRKQTERPKETLRHGEREDRQRYREKGVLDIEVGKNTVVQITAEV